MLKFFIMSKNILYLCRYFRKIIDILTRRRTARGLGPKTGRTLLLMLAVLTNAITVSSLVPPARAAGVDAQKLYKKHCRICHGNEGAGDGKLLQKYAVTAPDWSDAETTENVSGDFMIDIISLGGKKLGKSKKMPAFAKKLSNEEMLALVEFIRGLGS